MTKPNLCSVVIPLFNEAESLQELHRRLQKVFDQAGLNYEVIFIDDGSTDNSMNILKEIVVKDKNCRYVSFSRNFGHEAASTAGLVRASGDVVILMDGDLQDPPEFIPVLLEKWNLGYEVVYVRRQKRQGESIFKRFSAWLFYRLLNLFSEVQIPADVGDFRLMDKKVVQAFKNFPETNRFVRGIIAWLGFRQIGVEYERPQRIKGVTKYDFFKLCYLALDAVVSFSTSLLRFATFAGITVGVLSFVAVLVILIQKIFFGIPIPGYALIATGIFFLGGLLLLYLGIIGEYLGKTYRQVQQRPLYIVKEEFDGKSSL